jgi:hypothetical protein
MLDPAAHNRAAWDRRVEAGDEWTRPVSADVIARARAGDWSVVLIGYRPRVRVAVVQWRLLGHRFGGPVPVSGDRRHEHIPARRTPQSPCRIPHLGRNDAGYVDNGVPRPRLGEPVETRAVGPITVHDPDTGRRSR